MTFPQLSEQDRISRLGAPAGKVRMVLDTDTYNEIDDQFALTYALLSPDKLSVEAIYAAPFHNQPFHGARRWHGEKLRGDPAPAGFSRAVSGWLRLSWIY